MNSNLVLGASWFKVKTAFQVVDNPSCVFMGLNPLRVTNSHENDLTIVFHVSFFLLGWTQDPKASQAVAKAGTGVEATMKEVTAKLGKAPSCYHLVHCGGRRAGIDKRIGEVTKAVKKVAGDTPFIMEFTFGEYGYEKDGRNTCGGLMLSFTAFA